jgi:CheY-like chemotaxis protein
VFSNTDTTGRHEKRADKKARLVRILHVEDNKVVADAVRDTLETAGWEVETYADGAVALTKITGSTHYDLLLFDYDLPGVSGIELVQQARNLAHRRDTPIIVLSAALGEAAAREVGANKFPAQAGGY